MSRIYLSPPDVRQLERELVNAALDSNWVAPVGPDLDAFEREVAIATGVSAAVGLTSGTAALHLAMLELGITTGDPVFVSTFTFAATANAVAYVGATPVFIDCDPLTWNMSPDLVAAELGQRARHGTLPKAAIVVDLYGQCADYERLLPLFTEYGIPVVEDAAEALGATYRGQRAGSFGTCGVMSFNGNKIITCSGGGMLLCHDQTLAGRARHLATQAREPYPHYEHNEIGYNYRLSNILAAFGRGQLASLEERIARRRHINLTYRQSLEKAPGVSFLPIADYGVPNYWLTCITVNPAFSKVTSEDIRLHLEELDIESRPTWKPLHLQPVFRDAPRVVDGTSESLFDSGLCLPSGSGLSDADLNFVVDSLTAFVTI